MEQLQGVLMSNVVFDRRVELRVLRATTDGVIAAPCHRQTFVANLLELYSR